MSGAVAFTPGPNNIICTAIGVSHGFRRALPYAFGVTVGFPLLIVAVGAGLGGLIKLYPQILSVVKVIGGLMLLYMSYKIATAPPHDPDDHDWTHGSTPGFFYALMFQWVNPKAITFSFSVVSVFLRPHNVVVDLATLAAINAFISLSSTCTWAMTGMLIRRALHNPRRERMFNLVMGGLLCVSALYIVFS